MKISYCLKSEASKISLIIILLGVCLTSKSQNRDTNYDKELVTFMNYVRDSVLKTNSWADDSIIQMRSSWYLPWTFQDSLLKGKYALFSKNDVQQIIRGLKDKSTFLLTPEMFKQARKSKIDTIGDYFHNLYKSKIYLNYYIFNKIADSIWNKKVCYNSLHIIVPSNSKYVQALVEKYNLELSGINRYFKNHSYLYSFRKPLFLENYTYCILQYFDYSKGFFIMLYKKQKENWKYVKRLYFYENVAYD